MFSNQNKHFRILRFNTSKVNDDKINMMDRRIVLESLHIHLNPLKTGKWVLILYSLLLSACTLEFNLQSLTTSISGTAEMFKSVSVSSLSHCPNGKVSLHALEENGNINSSIISSSEVSADGTFELEAGQLGSAIDKSLSTQYVLKAEGCNKIFYRPLTGASAQNITAISTLVTMTNHLPPHLRRDLTDISVTEMSQALKAFESISTGDLASTWEAIVTDNSLEQNFQDLTGTSAQRLKELPPTNLTRSGAAQISEGNAHQYTVIASHWHPDYTIAYEWSLDGQVVSTANSWSFTPGPNSQGVHSVVLKLGMADSGIINVAKPVHEDTFHLQIENSIPPVAPFLNLIGSEFRNTPGVSLQMATGPGLIHCASFSKLALTLNPFLAPTPSAFNLECNQDGIQVENLTLPADGVHALALWAMDSAGNISTSPSTVSVVVDSVHPTLNLSSTGNLGGGSVAGVPFIAADTLSGLATVKLYYAENGVNFTEVADLLNTASPYPWTVPMTDITTAKLRIVATDKAGNSNEVVSGSFTIDSQKPTAHLAALTASPTSSSSLDFSITLSESVQTISAASFSVTNGALTDLTGSGTSYTGTITPSIASGSSGTVSVQIASGKLADGVGNTNIASNTLHWNVDLKGPVLNLSTPIVANSVRGSRPGHPSEVNISWTVTEPNPAANAYSVEYSTNAGSTWIPIASSLNTTSYLWSVPDLNTSQAKLRLSGIDSLGNATSVVTPDFIIDSTPPELTFFSINDDADITLSAIVTAKVNASDALSGVSAVRIANASISCQAAYADNNWNVFTNGGGTQTYSVTTSFSNGPKRLCAWAKDRAGNISEITANSGEGQPFIDTDTINLDMGSAPVFTSLTVTNNNVASPLYGTTNFAAGDQIRINFTVTDETALSTTPVTVELTTNNSTYSVAAPAAIVGSIPAGQTSWTQSFVGLSASDSGFFRIRLVAKDSNGNTSNIQSAGLNTGKWSYFAGTNDVGNGSSAISARLNFYGMTGTRSSVAINSKNEIFVITSDGLRKIDPLTGNITHYLTYSTTEAGVPGTVDGATRIITAGGPIDSTQDGDLLYIRAHERMYRLNLLTNYIEIYMAGGSSVTTSDPANTFVWRSGTLTIDPVTKDIYFVNTCDPNDFLSSSSVTSVKIQKITQDPVTKAAATVSDIAGNCVKGNIIDGANALQTPLENTIHRGSHGSLVYVPETGALYSSQLSQRLVKIINGKVYTANNMSPYGITGIYLPQQNKVYYTFAEGDAYQLYSFTPNADEDFNESITLYLKRDANCPDKSCKNDGTLVSEAGAVPGQLFSVGGQLGFVDGMRNSDGIGQLRMVDSVTQKIQTLAGVDRFWGDGKEAGVVRFGGIFGLRYKTQNLANFPAGLYIGDGLGNRLLQADLTTGKVHVRAGNGISKTPSAGTAFSPNNSVARIRLGQDLGLFTINPTGLFTYFTNRQLFNVNSDETVEPLFGETSIANNIYAIADGTTNASNFAFCNDGSDILHGLSYDGAGNLYFGGYFSSCTPAYNKIMVRKANGAFYSVIGNLTVASSADCTTPGCAQEKSIQCASSVTGTNGCSIGNFDDRYSSGKGRLLFAETNKIRFVTDPTNPAQSTYGTLLSAARNIGAFYFKYKNPTVPSDDQMDRVYYLSGGKLYCYKVSAGADASCNDTSLGPAAPIDQIFSGTITEGPDGEIYVLNLNKTVIMKYTPDH